MRCWSTRVKSGRENFRASPEGEADRVRGSGQSLGIRHVVVWVIVSSCKRQMSGCSIQSNEFRLALMAFKLCQPRFHDGGGWLCHVDNEGESSYPDSRATDTSYWLCVFSWFKWIGQALSMYFDVVFGERKEPIVFHGKSHVTEILMCGARRCLKQPITSCNSLTMSTCKR